MNGDVIRPVRSREPSREALESLRTSDFFSPPSFTSTAVKSVASTDYAAKRSRILDLSLIPSPQMTSISNMTAANPAYAESRGGSSRTVNSLLDLDSENRSQSHYKVNHMASTTASLPTSQFPVHHWSMYGSPDMSSGYPVLNPFVTSYSRPLPYVSTFNTMATDFPTMQPKETKISVPYQLLSKSSHKLRIENTKTRSAMLCHLILTK